ncbi:MAG: sulfide/dihydroorotate dehydrogenase-like FAD/NAD-binding protein [Candidatus Brocadiales bacterium]|nr:sulfide/dihydroorotate dehydrogenase-like FAD/NAD-binding protein [Candidatus Bathyanammoxibius sp.]MCQ4573935.1 sulfide/dihydroorotate dehydrogenase-like FAD/NAD-binding protein [Candidatus Bathyanammoxibius amoris]
MFKVREKEQLSEVIYRLVIEAPRIARKRKAGQFVMVKVDETGERVPLTINDSDSEAGTITIVFQTVGYTTKLLATLKAGDYVQDVAGPLGQPTHIEKFGTVVSIGGGLGTALGMSITKALYEAGNHVIAMISARNKGLLMFEDEMKAISHELVICTDDGSCGFHGFPTQALKKLIDDGKKIDLVVAVGPVPLMAAVSEVTRPYGIKTVVSLNPIMVDATGMCGACRVTVGGVTRFGCVEGPEFDGHEVDFKELMTRLKIYADEEKEMNDRFNSTHGAQVAQEAKK